MSQSRVMICGAGLKASHFLGGLLTKGVKPARVVSYAQNGDVSHAFEKLRKACGANGIDFIENRAPKIFDFTDVDVIFMIGWQYLLPQTDERCIVFHDSLLPKYRGFAPTVTALINGETEIGVTAFTPVAKVDAGPIVGQGEIAVQHPMRIEDALAEQARLMVDLAVELLEKRQSGPLPTTPQNEEMATYAVWRDDDDFWIDWKCSAAEIQRFVYAVGFPYTGARAMLADHEVWIDDCTPLDDLVFPLRHPGKIWTICDGDPVVICGTGILRISKMRASSGQTLKAERLRQRFRGSPAR